MFSSWEDVSEEEATTSDRGHGEEEHAVAETNVSPIICLESELDYEEIDDNEYYDKQTNETREKYIKRKVKLTFPLLETFVIKLCL